MASLSLTRRALFDIAEIDRFSEARWGKRVADEYIAAIDEALARLAASPGLLRSRSDLSLRLRFYRVGRHFLVCDIVDDHVYVLAVRHGSADLPSRIAELEPHLVEEAELMHRRVRTRK